MKREDLIKGKALVKEIDRVEATIKNVTSQKESPYLSVEVSFHTVSVRDDIIFEGSDIGFLLAMLHSYHEELKERLEKL